MKEKEEGAEKKKSQEQDQEQEQEQDQEQDERKEAVNLREKALEGKETLPSSLKTLVDRARLELAFTIEDLIRHRVKHIIKARCSWARCSGHSRFFVLLPVIGSSPRLTRAASTPPTVPVPTTATTAATSTIPGIHYNTKFSYIFSAIVGTFQKSRIKSTLIGSARTAGYQPACLRSKILTSSNFGRSSLWWATM